jgi:hypothetical protein
LLKSLNVMSDEEILAEKRRRDAVIKQRLKESGEDFNQKYERQMIQFRLR